MRTKEDRRARTVARSTPERIFFGHFLGCVAGAAGAVIIAPLVKKYVLPRLGLDDTPRDQDGLIPDKLPQRTSPFDRG